MKRVFVAMIAILSLAGYGRAADGPAPVAKSGQAQWTFMFMINGKCDLEQEALEIANEIESVGSSDEVNLVVELGRMRGSGGPQEESWRGIRRYRMERDSNPKRLSTKEDERLDGNMGSGQHLSDFVAWAKARYPAKKYALVIWGHSSGWKMQPVVSLEDLVGGNKAISFDDVTGGKISTEELERALSRMGGLELYGSDACVMQDSAVVYQLGRSAKVYVASEDFVSGKGFSYAPFLAALRDNPSMDEEELGANMVSAYFGSVLSAVRSSQVPVYAGLLDDFAGAMRSAGENDLYRRIRDGLKTLGRYEGRDIGLFAERVAAQSSNASVRMSAGALTAFLSDRNKLVLAVKGRGEYASMKGMGIYFPSSGYMSRFSELRLAADTQWDEFIRGLMK